MKLLIPAEYGGNTMNTKFKKFLEDQKQEMLKHKWIVSEQAARDMGEEALKEWIAKFAKEFREAWEKENGPVDL